jgi:hypothetical protein
MLADLDSLERRVPNLVKKAQQGDKDAKIEASVLGQALDLLRASKPARLTQPRDAEEEKALKRAQLLTAKPVLYVCNVDEGDAASGNGPVGRVFDKAAAEGASRSRRLGRDRGRDRDAREEDRAAFLPTSASPKPASPRHPRRLRAARAHHLLHRRAQGVARLDGRAGQGAAGARVPSTDFERGFIRAETIAYDDFIACGGEAGARTPASCAPRARSTSSRTATCCCSGSTSERPSSRSAPTKGRTPSRR